MALKVVSGLSQTRGRAPSAPGSRAKAAAVTATATAARLQTKAWEDKFNRGTLKNWSDIEVDVPDTFTKSPLTRATLAMFSSIYIDQQKVMATHPVVAQPKATDIKNVSVDMGPIKLFPQQQKAVNECLNTWPERNGFVFPLQTGQGKTMIAAAIIKHFQKNNYYNLPVTDMPWPKIMYLTKSSVIHKTKRELIRVGVQGVGGDVLVYGHDSFNARALSCYFREKKEKRFGTECTVFEYLLTPPAVLVLDECHAYKKQESKKSKRAEALVRAVRDSGGIIAFTSATPYVTVDDTWLLSYALGMKWKDGQVIDWYNFSAFARQIASPSLPSEAVGEAINRYNKAIGPSFIKPPNDPSRIKSHNSIKLFKWINEEQRKKYLKAEEDFLEAKKRIGESTQNMDMAAFTIFRAAEEYLKMPNFADWAIESVSRGKAPVMCVCFQDSLRRLVLELIDRGVKREEITLVWGGRTEIKESEIMQPEEFAQILMGRANGIEPEGKVRTKFLKTQRYWQERIKLGETKDQQSERNKRLLELNLHGQSLSQRQTEIDNFQDGRTRYCIFTMSAGGAGLDLDQQAAHILPREMMSTICYYGEEFLQAFGRIKRKSTIADVWQSMGFFEESIAAKHVAPRLVKKLAAIGATTGAGLDLANLLDKAAPSDTPAVSEAAVEDTSEVNDDLIDDGIDEDEEGEE